MTTTVRAAVLVRPGLIELQELPMPSLDEGGAIARVRMSGICGTDKHSYRGESVQYKGTKNEIDLPFPIIQGHENVLEIVDISPEESYVLTLERVQGGSAHTASFHTQEGDLKTNVPFTPLLLDEHFSACICSVLTPNALLMASISYCTRTEL